MACRPDTPPTPTSFDPQPPPRSQHDPLPENYEYDFVDEPPKDFYCAVSLDLLLDPHQTDCCGQHLASEIAERLKREGKPCPMCKNEPLSTHADLYHRRRVNQVAVRCLYSGCEKVVELCDLRRHVTGCRKQPWKCAHCEFAGLKEAEPEHTRTCARFPVECPNRCRGPGGTVPRCELEKHRLGCPLEEVDCEYTAFGCCTERLSRRDMEKHLEERETHHLVKMCARNLSLTQELVRKGEERDSQIAQLQSQLAKMEDEMKESVRSAQELTTSKIVDMERQMVSQLRGLEERVAMLDLQHQTECTLPPVEFTVTNFNGLKLQNLEWRSPPFYTHHGGYKMCIGLQPDYVHMSLHLYKMIDSNTDQLQWPIIIHVCLHIQNQRTGEWEREYVNHKVQSKPSKSWEVSSSEYQYLKDMRPYIKNNQLKLRVTNFNTLLSIL